MLVECVKQRPEFSLRGDSRMRRCAAALTIARICRRCNEKRYASGAFRGSSEDGAAVHVSRNRARPPRDVRGSSVMALAVAGSQLVQVANRAPPAVSFLAVPSLAVSV